jgi:hypothetical protein
VGLLEGADAYGLVEAVVTSVVVLSNLIPISATSTVDHVGGVEVRRVPWRALVPQDDRSNRNGRDSLVQGEVHRVMAAIGRTCSIIHSASLRLKQL